MDASNTWEDDSASLIYMGFRAQEICQSLVKMSWNDDYVYLPVLRQAIWYMRAKARRASPLLARSGLSLSGTQSLTNIRSGIWIQQAAFLAITTLFYPFLSEANTVFHCRKWVNRWYDPVWGVEVAPVAPAKMDQTKPKQQLSCFRLSVKIQTLRNHADFDVSNCMLKKWIMWWIIW